MASSSVDKELETLIRARYPIIYIVSWEEQRVENALRKIAQDRGKKIFFWTVTQGMVSNPNHRDNATRDPIAALDAVIDSRDQALFVLKDYHAFISDVTVTRRLRDLTAALKTSYKTLIILAPTLKLPSELEKEIAVIDYGLPDHDDLDIILEKVIQAVKENPQIDCNLSDLERDQVLKAAQGLTAMEAENVFAKSLIEKHKFDVDVVLGEKEQIIRKSGILEYYPFSEGIEDVGGLNLLKEWMEKRTVAFTEKARDFGLPSPRGVLLLGVQGCGKCFAKDTPVLMFNGEVKAVQDVMAGDLVMGPDSQPRRVLSTTQGQSEMFRVAPTKGNPYTVNADHILTLRMSGARRCYKQADADGIVNITVRDYLLQGASFKQRALGYRTGVDFPAAPVPLDPYFLGVWLGDGSEKTPSVTTADEIIVEYVNKTAVAHGLNVRRAEKSRPNRAATYFITAGNQGRTVNPLFNKLRDLGVLGNKHIPLLYRANSRDVRLHLLAGIIDTDGCLWGNDYDVIQKRKQLAEDIAFVARSLGLAAYVYPCKKSCTLNGVRFTGNYYRVHISGDTDMIPVRLHQKQALPRQQRKNVLNTGIRVEPVGLGDYYGFAIDGDHRFLLDDFTVVHNSLSAKAIGSLWRLPLLRLDVGRIFAGIVGSSEENMRKAIRVAESVAPCVAGDTRITLADGSEQTIEALWEGQEEGLHVLAMDENWQIVPTRVHAITRREAPDLFTITLKHGGLQATSNHQHPVLRDGDLHWVRTDQLRTDDHIAVPRSIPTRPDLPKMIEFLPPETRLYVEGALAYARPEAQTPQRRYAARERDADYVKVEELALPHAHPPFAEVTEFTSGRGGFQNSGVSRLPETLNEEIGYLLGLIASDGFFAQRSRIGFVNTDMTLHHLFKERMERQFDVCVKTVLYEWDGKSRLVGTSERSEFRPCYTSYADNNLLRKILINIQDRLLMMPQAFLNAWARGYFDGDGCISNCETADPKITLTSKRKPENRIVRAVLHRIGFPTTNFGYENIEITGTQNVRRFITQVGSFHPFRKERMEAWLQMGPVAQEKDRTDMIPIGSKLLHARKAVGMGSNHFKHTYSSLIHRYETNLGAPNRERLRSIVAEMTARVPTGQAEPKELTELRRLAEAPITWSKVISVEEAPTPEWVYDLACDGPHTFLSNAIVTHNCILWLDELEKGFSGTQSSGMSDGGTTSRVFGTFLTWMQDKKAAAFVVATSNDVTSLPPELLRKGRFDEIFFIDLPPSEERKQIFRIHLRKRKRNPDDFDLERLAVATPGFSGAEIEAVVVDALYDAFDETKELTTDSIVAAAAHTVPLSMTMRERIEDLREWARTRARAASSVQAEGMDEITEQLLLAKAGVDEKADEQARALAAQLPPASVIGDGRLEEGAADGRAKDGGQGETDPASPWTTPEDLQTQ